MAVLVEMAFAVIVVVGLLTIITCFGGFTGWSMLARLDSAGGLFISLLADPTTGGVTASFAMLGDFIVAEPKALIGFAGPRTIWNTIKVELPEGFQRSEFLQEPGFVDLVANKERQKAARASAFEEVVLKLRHYRNLRPSASKVGPPIIQVP